MPLSYEKNKVHIYNYRLKNPEKIREQNKKDCKKYYQYKQISIIFRNILIDDLFN
jgi:hypothetical protein